MMPLMAMLSGQDKSRGIPQTADWSASPRLLEVLQALNEVLDAALSEDFDAGVEAA